MLPKARATGNLTLRMNALARELLVDDEGRIRAVSIVNRLTKQEEEIRRACSCWAVGRLRARGYC